MKFRYFIILLACYVALFVSAVPLYLYLDRNNTENAEAICIMENSSAKETIIANVLIHDGRLYPVESEKRDGCLIIYEGGMEKDYPFAVFVDNGYDHCCVDGE